MTKACTIRWLLFGLYLAVAGCATVPGEGEDEVSVEQERDTTTTIEDDGTIRHSVPDRTVALLWERSERARREDRIEDAIGSLERALQISPEDPVLWSRMAELQLLRGEYAVAENLAVIPGRVGGRGRAARRSGVRGGVHVCRCLIPPPVNEARFSLRRSRFAPAVRFVLPDLFGPFRDDRNPATTAGFQSWSISSVESYRPDNRRGTWAFPPRSRSVLAATFFGDRRARVRR
jgi:hypothetical protein